MYSINTYEASRGLGVYHPPARILRLRKKGYPIDTVWQSSWQKMAIRTALAAICCATGIIAMNHDRESWLERLEMLLARFSHLGIGADVASLSLIELWSLYVYLSQLMEG